jgi:hypothetical protein
VLSGEGAARAAHEQTIRASSGGDDDFGDIANARGADLPRAGPRSS